jgi:hypothetical protein
MPKAVLETLAACGFEAEVANPDYKGGAMLRIRGAGGPLYDRFEHDASADDAKQWAARHKPRTD